MLKGRLRLGGLSLVARVAAIVIAAMLLLQLIAAAGYYLRGDRPSWPRMESPLIDKVVATVRLIERTPAAERAAVLQAVASPDVAVALVAGPPAGLSPRGIPQFTGEIRSRLGDPGRLVEATFFRTGWLSQEPRPESYLPGPFEREQLRVAVGLADGSFLQVTVGSALIYQLFGLPVGLLAGIFGFLVAGLAVLLVAREMRPVRDLAEAVGAVRGTFVPVSEPRGGAREVRTLARAINAMQARLDRLLRSRAFVLGAISHDLRTYLTRLRLRIEALPDPEARQRAARDVEDMLALVSDTLAFARANFADGSISDLAALVAAACGELEEAGAPVTLQAPPGPLPVAGSRVALDRLVANLLENALAYGGQADVSLAVAGGVATLTVADRGPGVPESERERIFEPFERLEGSRSRTLGGAGLGLAIARQIAESYGGSLTVADRPGGGAAFLLRLPLAKA